MNPTLWLNVCVFLFLLPLQSFNVEKGKPKTGRTHQIRIHLAHLGFPIVGDPLYHNFPKQRERRFVNQHEIISSRKIEEKEYLKDPGQSFNSPEYVSEFDDMCLRCQEPPMDAKLEDMYLCLHSIKYEGHRWKFESEPPFWATKYINKL